MAVVAWHSEHHHRCFLSRKLAMSMTLAAQSLRTAAAAVEPSASTETGKEVFQRWARCDGMEAKNGDSKSRLVRAEG